MTNTPVKSYLNPSDLIPEKDPSAHFHTPNTHLTKHISKPIHRKNHDSKTLNDPFFNLIETDDSDSDLERDPIAHKIDSISSLDSEILLDANFHHKSNDNASTPSETYEFGENDGNHQIHKFPSIFPSDIPKFDSMLFTSNGLQIQSARRQSYENENTKDPLIHHLRFGKDNYNSEENAEDSGKVMIPLQATKIASSKSKSYYPIHESISFDRKGSSMLNELDMYNDDDIDPSANLPTPVPIQLLAEPNLSVKFKRKTLPVAKYSFPFTLSNDKPNEINDSVPKHDNDSNSDENSHSDVVKYEDDPSLQAFPNIAKTLDEILFKNCVICSKRITENGIFINGQYYHNKCCVCSKCRKKLSPKVTNPTEKHCYLYHDKLLCKNCAHLKGQINLCQLCGQKIFEQDDEIELPNGRKAHRSCICCYKCGKKLDYQTATLINEDDYASKFSQRAATGANNTVIKLKHIRRTSNFDVDSLIDFENGIHICKYMCDRCIQHLSNNCLCCICQKPILENIVIKNQRMLHRLCFRCEYKNCDKHLYGNSYVVHHNKFFCWEHGEIYQTTCAFCKSHFNVLETDRIKWNGKMYHKVCFVCRVCGKNLDPQTCLKIHGRPHCAECFQLRVNEGDCDENGRSSIVNKKSKKRRSLNQDTNSNERFDLSNDSNQSCAKFRVHDQSIKGRHKHIAAKSVQRMKRFRDQYNIDVIRPHYGDKNFEKAVHYSPPKELNVFKKL